MLFEHLFVSQVWASAAARDHDVRVSTCRTRGGLEIDFVVDVGGERWLVEAKASTRTQAADAGALVRAADAYFGKKARRLVVHSGTTARVYDGVPHLPWQDALREMGL